MIKCNKCGVSDAEVTHICPPLGGSMTVTWPNSSSFTFPPTGQQCHRCGKPAVGHWNPIPNFTAAAPMTTGPYPLCSEHMAETFGYATKAELEAARNRIAELESQIKALRAG